MSNLIFLFSVKHQSKVKGTPGSTASKEQHLEDEPAVWRRSQHGGVWKGPEGAGAAVVHGDTGVTHPQQRQFP